MSRAALAVAACLAFGCADAAVEIRSYQTRLDVADDGAAQARAEVVLTGARAGRVRLPVGFAALSDLRLAPAPPGITIADDGPDQPLVYANHAFAYPHRLSDRRGAQAHLPVPAGRHHRPR